MEETLGDACSSPAADVRGYVESVKHPRRSARKGEAPSGSLSPG